MNSDDFAVVRSFNFVLKEAGLKLNEVDHIVFYEKRESRNAGVFCMMKKN
mgnify:CR=1 FL=1